MPRKTVWGWVAVAAVAIGIWGVCAKAAPTTCKFSFQISDKLTIYAQVQNSELRMAATADGVAAATPVKAQKQAPLRFTEIPLPIPEAMLPKGCTGIRTELTVYDNRPQADAFMVVAPMKLMMVDDRKAVWAYRVTLFGQQTDAKKDMVLQVPTLDKLSLEVATKDLSSGGARKLGVGVRLKTGDVELRGVQKDGVDVNVQMKVTDSANTAIDSASKPLSSFGFS